MGIKHIMGIKYLPTTVRLYLKLVVCVFLKSTRHLYTPSSRRLTSRTTKAAVGAATEKCARGPKTSGADQ